MTASTLGRREALILGAGALFVSCTEPAVGMFRRKDKSPYQSNERARSRAATVTEVLPEGRRALPILTRSSPEYIRHAVDRYRWIVTQGDWPRLALSKVLSIGVRGEDVILLKKRLALEGYLMGGGIADVFDNPTREAVIRFQKNHGVEPTGRIDGRTLAILNVPAQHRLATLLANLPRLQEYSRNLADRNIIVNIPAAQLEAVSEGNVYSRHNVIVGKPDRPSPVVMTSISNLNFNPYWNIPPSIVEKDIIPALLNDPNHLRKLTIRVFNGRGNEVDATTIDWLNTPGDRYHLRQEPGKDNAMASVKINFPSPFGVYMHDTPTKDLFAAGERYLSSGCVRVDQIHILVNWILRGQGGWDLGRIMEVSESHERVDVQVREGPQLRWVYLTSWVSRDGSVNFRPDIYELDGTGFVIGQPLPTGQGVGSQRWVMKPLPYRPEVNRTTIESLISEGEKYVKRPKPSNPLSTIKRFFVDY